MLSFPIMQDFLISIHGRDYNRSLLAVGGAVRSWYGFRVEDGTGTSNPVPRLDDFAVRSHTC